MKMIKSLMIILVLSLIVLTGCEEETKRDEYDLISDSESGFYFALEDDSEEIFIVRNSSIMGNISITNIISCSDYQDDEFKLNNVVDTSLILGCLLTEFNNVTPKETEEILERYGIKVFWGSFNIEQEMEIRS